MPPLELGKQAALHLRTVALGVEDGDRKRSCRHCAEYADEFFILTQSGECPGGGRVAAGAHAQQAGKLRTIGFLGPNAHSAANEWVAVLAQRLRDVETHKAATSAWVGAQP